MKSLVKIFYQTFLKKNSSALSKELLIKLFKKQIY